MEGGEGVRFVDSDEAGVVVWVDYELGALRPKGFGAAEGEGGVEDAKDYVVLCQEKGAKICRSGWPAGESGRNDGFAGLDGYGEDSVDCLYVVLRDCG